MASAVSVGIDLGTSTSEVGWYDSVAGEVRFVPFGEGRFVVPSAVWFDRERNRTVVGWQAYAMRVRKHQEVVLNIKRHMGTRFRFELDGREYTPAQISAEILKYLKSEAERYTDAEVTRAVITVPAKFGTLDRQHTEEAARLAGLEPLMLLPEPVAALVGYPGLPREHGREYLAMVYDFGGGTFDCTVVRVKGNQYQVVSKAGERDLGGARIDELIAERILRPKVLQAGFDLARDEEWAREIQARIIDVAENAKKALAEEGRRSVTAVLPNLTAPGRGTQTIRVQITQDDVLDSIGHLLRVAGEQMEIALANAHLSREDIDVVVLVGGSTRLPAIRHAVRTFMGEKAFDENEGPGMVRKVLADTDPDLPVARGAAIVAAAFGKEQQIELVDILLDNVYLRIPGALARFQPLFARGTDIAQAKRELHLGWPRSKTAALDLYEGEREGRPGANYLGTIKLGPAELSPGTRVTLAIQYRTDRALPEVSARVQETGVPVKAEMVYEQDSVVVTGNPQLQIAKELDLVFCIDTTGSMVYGGHLERVRQHCMAFADSVARSALDIRLAAISFGDRRGGERERVYSFTPDPRLFVTRIASLNENDGGDERESALDAIDSALRLPLRGGETARHRVILVTDAPPQPVESGTLEQLVSGLAQRNVRVDIAGPFCPEYDTVVAGTGGRLYDIDRDLHQLFADLEESICSSHSEAEG